MARGNDFNSASSQFFIMHQAESSLDGNYAAFGHVVSGMDVVDRIAAAPVNPTITSTGKIEYSVPVTKPVISSIKITEGVSSYGWKQSGNRWWYSYDSVTAKGLGKSYPTNESILINGELYYFDSHGWMKTGWVQDSNGNWKYLNASGKTVTNWIRSGGIWYYLNPSDGIMVANKEQVIGGRTYRFAASGAMVTGWVKTGSNWQHYDASGARTSGWLRSGGAWYYLKPYDNDVMLSSTMTAISGQNYIFDANGAMYTGWARQGSWYLCNASGAVVTGWQRVNGVWYYLDPDNKGAMIESTMKDIGNETYIFSSSGAMRTGWVSDAGEWYYFRSSGEMAKGWIYDGRAWYYLNPSNGVMAKNTVINGYYVDKTGAWVS